MKNKGFTLIELLAVLLILTIIALITTPIVTNVLEGSRQNTFESSIEQLINIARMDYNEYGRLGEVTYNYNNDKFVCSGCDDGKNLTLDYSGSLDASGTIIYENGKVKELNIKGQEFTATYNNGVEVTKNEE